MCLEFKSSFYISCKIFYDNNRSVFKNLLVLSQESPNNPRTEDAAELPELHPPTQNAYPVWEYFGFLKDAEGSVVFDGFPICKICRQRVESKDGDTRNMFQHLKANHRGVYLQIKVTSLTCQTQNCTSRW